MKKKVAKQLRKMADALAFNKPPEEKRKMYRRFKNIHHEQKKK